MTDWDPFYHVNTAWDSIINWAGSETGTAQAAQTILQAQQAHSDNLNKANNGLLIIAAGIGALLLFRK